MARPRPQRSDPPPGRWRWAAPTARRNSARPAAPLLVRRPPGHSAPRAIFKRSIHCPAGKAIRRAAKATKRKPTEPARLKRSPQAWTRRDILVGRKRPEPRAAQVYLRATLAQPRPQNKASAINKFARRARRAESVSRQSSAPTPVALVHRIRPRRWQGRALASAKPRAPPGTLPAKYAPPSRPVRSPLIRPLSGMTRSRLWKRAARLTRMSRPVAMMVAPTCRYAARVASSSTSEPLPASAHPSSASTRPAAAAATTGSQ